MAFIKKGKVPPFSSINNMKVDAVPHNGTETDSKSTSIYEAYSVTTWAKSIGWPDL